MGKRRKLEGGTCQAALGTDMEEQVRSPHPGRAFRRDPVSTAPKTPHKSLSGAGQLSAVTPGRVRGERKGQTPRSS